MKRRKRGSRTSRPAARPSTRRTTWTLPEDVLEGVERLAAERCQTVSSAAAYLLQEALRMHPRAQSGTDFLELLQRSFAGLNEEEQMLVDGIILEEPDTESK